MIAVINARTLGVTEYDLDWSDVIDEDGVVKGLGADGIYALAEDGDLTPSPMVETGRMDFGATTPKTAERAYVLAQGDDDLALTVIADGPAGAVEVAYQLPARALDGQTERTVRLGRGLEGQRIGLRLEPAGGGAWSLGGLALRLLARLRNR